MVTLPAFDPIKFLIERKLGAGARNALEQFPPSLSRGHARKPPDLGLIKQVQEYRSTLEALSQSEIQSRVDAEIAKLAQEQLEKAEREERARFFNQPSVRADFEHWSKAAHWTLDEAIALSLGKAPEVVNWSSLQPYIAIGSPFVVQYARRRDLALRAKAWEQLFDPVLPGIFLGWAKRLDIAVPQELAAAVEKRGVQVGDWKTLYDKAVADLTREIELRDKTITEWRTAFEQASAFLDVERKKAIEILEEKNCQITELKKRVASAESEQAAIPPEKTLGVRERDSLLKLVIGMAVKGYGFDPKATRSEKTSEIAGDLAEAGLPLEADTVRKWLREAAELLPPT